MLVNFQLLLWRLLRSLVLSLARYPDLTWSRVLAEHLTQFYLE